MKRKLILTSMMLLLCLTGAAQVLGSVDFDAVKKEITDRESPYFYPRLLARWERQDTTLGPDEVKFLYYGWVFQPQYAPYATHDEWEKFQLLLDKGKFEKGITLGQKILKEEPLNIRLHVMLAWAMNKAGNAPGAALHRWQWGRLFDVIDLSGDGQSCETAWVVTCVQDEYDWLSVRQVSYVGQSLVGSCDMFECKRTARWDRESAWFNISIALKKMSEALEKGN